MVYNKKIRREIPNNWKVENLKENSLSDVIKPGVDDFEQKTYYATSNINDTNISEGTIIEFETRENRANMQPTINSVWFAKMKNSIKHLFLNEEMLPLINSSILSTGFIGIQCNHLSFEYIASFIENKNFEITKDLMSHGATQQAINNTDLISIPLIVPENNILEKFHAKTKPIYALISKNKIENQQLTRLRDFLLPLLMNGQATIEE